MKKNFFDLLVGNKYLYYLGIMLIGWYALDKNKTSSREVRTKDAIETDYREGLRIIETDEQFLKLKNQALPKEYIQADGVWVVHTTDIPKTSYQLNDKLQQTYQKLKGTLAPWFQADVPVIWRNRGNNKAKIYAYINAMLQLAARKKVQSSTIKIIGKSEFDSVFKRPK